MKRNAILVAATAMFTVLFSGLAAAASSPITNGSFQTGDFTGWSVRDTTHCFYTVCGDGTASVAHCVPAAPGDTDGNCASFAGINVSAGQNLSSTNVHKYSISGCIKHTGGGTATAGGAVNFSVSGETGWVCQTATYNNPYGVMQRIPPLTISEVSSPDKDGHITPGTGYFDQYVFTVLKK